MNAPKDDTERRIAEREADDAYVAALEEERNRLQNELEEQKNWNALYQADLATARNVERDMDALFEQLRRERDAATAREAETKLEKERLQARLSALTDAAKSVCEMAENQGVMTLDWPDIIQVLRDALNQDGDA